MPHPYTKPAFFRRWSQEEKQLLVKLKEVDRLPWEKIAAQIPGTDAGRCKGVYAQIRRKIRRQREAYAEVRAELEGNQTIDRPILSAHELVHTRGPRLPEAARNERDQRAQLQMRRDDITANIFGDPLPGYSALDRANVHLPVSKRTNGDAK